MLLVTNFTKTTRHLRQSPTWVHPAS